HLGDVDTALASASRRFDASYRVAYIAHCPLEPRAAVAEWTGSDLAVWTGTQRPFGVKGELAEAFHLPPERVRVMMPDTGSGYGGEHNRGGGREGERLARSETAGSPPARRRSRPRVSHVERGGPCRSSGRDTKS